MLTLESWRFPVLGEVSCSTSLIAKETEQGVTITLKAVLLLKISEILFYFLVGAYWNVQGQETKGSLEFSCKTLSLILITNRATIVVNAQKEEIYFSSALVILSMPNGKVTQGTKLAQGKFLLKKESSLVLTDINRNHKI